MKTVKRIIITDCSDLDEGFAIAIYSSRNVVEKKNRTPRQIASLLEAIDMEVSMGRGSIFTAIQNDHIGVDFSREG